jgi:hypothetical protein
MHGKREAPPPASSAVAGGKAKVPISVPTGSLDGDDALLALERQFEVLAGEFAILSRAKINQNGKGTFGHGCQDAGPINQTSPSERSCELGRAGDATGQPAAERLRQLEAAQARLEPVERAIMATPAETVVGLGVKARHVAYVISEYWAEPLEKADWDRRAVRLLIEAVCVAAGRPLAIGEPANDDSAGEHRPERT